MPDTQILEFSSQIEVALRIKSVTSDWIEGTIELTLLGGRHEQNFKTENGTEIRFDVPLPVGSAEVTVKVFAEGVSSACVAGEIEVFGQNMKIGKLCDNVSIGAVA